MIMYDTLDEVPWNSVTAVAAPSGSTVGIDANGFAVWLTGPRAGQRIPLDAHGPWIEREHAGYCWPTCGCADSEEWDWDGFADAINGDPT